MRRAFKAGTPEHKALVERIAANVRRLRERRGWTQAQAATHCELSTFTFQCVEAGETSMSTATLSALCVGFGVEITELFHAAEAIVPRPPGRPVAQKTKRKRGSQ